MFSASLETESPIIPSDTKSYHDTSFSSWIKYISLRGIVQPSNSTTSSIEDPHPAAPFTNSIYILSGYFLYVNDFVSSYFTAFLLRLLQEVHVEEGT
jgi:hypothetical protein